MILPFFAKHIYYTTVKRPSQQKSASFPEIFLKSTKIDNFFPCFRAIPHKHRKVKTDEFRRISDTGVAFVPVEFYH